MKVGIVAAAVLPIAMLGAIVLSTEGVYARGLDCPSSWPQELREGFFVDPSVNMVKDRLTGKSYLRMLCCGTSKIALAVGVSKC